MTGLDLTPVAAHLTEPHLAKRLHVTAVRLLAASRLVCALAAVAAVTLIARAHLDDSMFQVIRDGLAHVGVDLAQWRTRAPTLLRRRGVA